MSVRLTRIIRFLCLHIFVIGVFFMVRAFFLEPIIIPSSSMLPGLQLNDRVLVEKLTYRFTDVKRGDIVVFRAPPELGEEIDLIKRIIGLPGEKIQVKNGKVWVNEEELNEDYLLEEPDYLYGPETIPDHYYLVLGDNRRSSYDSHMWGFVPRQNIIGKAWIRCWPLSRIGILDPN